MLAVVFALADNLVTFLAFRAMLIAVFTFIALFAVIDPGANRAGPAIIAHEFTAVDAMLAFVGALTHVGVAVAAFRAMISAAFGALLADSAGFAKLNALAERAFAAFRAEEFLVAIDAMLADDRPYVLEVAIEPEEGILPMVEPGDGVSDMKLK